MGDDPYCNKIAYPDRATATWHKPFREEELGMTLRAYHCQSRACRPWRRWHLTSQLDADAKRRRNNRVNRKARIAVEMGRWYDDGGLSLEVARW